MLSEERNQQIFGIEKLPDQHITTCDGLCVVQIHLLGMSQQIRAEQGMHPNSHCLAPPHLRCVSDQVKMICLASVNLQVMHSYKVQAARSLTTGLL